MKRLIFHGVWSFNSSRFLNKPTIILLPGFYLITVYHRKYSRQFQTAEFAQNAKHFETLNIFWPPGSITNACAAILTAWRQVVRAHYRWIQGLTYGTVRLPLFVTPARVQLWSSDNFKSFSALILHIRGFTIILWKTSQVYGSEITLLRIFSKSKVLLVLVVWMVRGHSIMRKEHLQIQWNFCCL